jgi:hypothetical protein
LKKVAPFKFRKNENFPKLGSKKRALVRKRVPFSSKKRNALKRFGKFLIFRNLGGVTFSKVLPKNETCANLRKKLAKFAGKI